MSKAGAKLNIKFEIEACMPEKFSKILELDGIEYKQIIKSFDLQKNKRMVFKAGEGAGRSGSFFFSTYDKRFLVKTMQGNEKKVLLNMIDDYVKHMRENPHSLISRIYGVFRISTSEFHPVDIMVMQHTAQLKSKANKKYEFDLKGSQFMRMR